MVTGTADLVDATGFQYRDREMNSGHLYRKTSLTFHARQFAPSAVS